jgi:hypothetical protein
LAQIPRKRAASGRFVERFTLNSTHIANKKVTLQNMPESANSVVVDAPYGPVQILGQDYIVTGQDVSWDGYGLETILESGDLLIIIYS